MSDDDKSNEFKYFRSRAEDELVSTLNNIAGTKELVIDSDLFRQIDRVTSASKLRSVGVKRIMRLDPNIGPPNYIRAYFIRPLLPSLKCVVELIQSNPRSSFEKAHILCVPRIQFLVKHLIECEDLLDCVVMTSVPSWEVVYLDSDLLSMEAEYVLGSTYLSNDYSALSLIAGSLINIQSVLGRIQCVYSIGDRSKRVSDIMDVLMSSMDDKNKAKLSSTPKRIGHLFLVDRAIDFVTPFLSQMIYEGLLDEVFGINAGVIKVPNAIIDIEPNDKESMLVLSNETDAVFKNLRFVHLTDLFGQIKAYAEQLRDEMNRQKTRVRKESISQIKSLVKDELREFFNRERLLQRHLALAEFIMQVKKQEDFKEHLKIERKMLRQANYSDCLESIYEYIHRGRHWTRSLQLACLMSACFDGIATSDFEILRSLFLATYGYDRLPLLLNLEKLGILKRQSFKGLFAQWVRRFDLFGEQDKAQPVQQQPPPHLRNLISLHGKTQTSAAAAAAVANFGLSSVSASVFDGGYAPLLVRLIECALLRAESVEELDKDFGVFHLNALAKRFRSRLITEALQGKEPNDVEKSVLVVFIGGCTHTELNSLRMVGEANGYKIRFLTTSIFNYERLLQSVDGDLTNV